MRTKSKYDRFPIVKRGYDPETVESHLAATVNDNDQVLDEAAAQIAALETDLEESQKHEEAVHLTILAATQTKEDMLEVAQRQADEARAAGRKQGDGIITDARMQAFQVVTEARKEADGIVAEARTEAAALLRSIEATTPIASGPSEREIELQSRVEEMQNVIAAMESELLSRPAISDTAEFESAPPVEDAEVPTLDHLSTNEEILSVDIEVAQEDGEEADLSDHVEDPAIENDIEIVVTDTASIEPVDESAGTLESIEVEDNDTAVESETSVDDGSITDDSETDAVRRSFYSRRSAKLPRIGAEAGRSAMAAAAGLRTGVTSKQDTNSSVPDRSQEFETV